MLLKWVNTRDSQLDKLNDIKCVLSFNCYLKKNAHLKSGHSSLLFDTSHTEDQDD